LFALPGFGAWLRWLGGVAVDRRAAHGLVGGTAAHLAAARERGESFWLAVAPEGTRSLGGGWRSGAYHLAVQAGVPVGLACFDFASRTVNLERFVQLSGDADADFALMAALYAGKQGKRPELASPVSLMGRP
ncbi:MAG TPA: glycerol acyltransferase, partial [Roseateles sp.]|nr:glycerol acyltransferase [Roseateles sp.]